MKQYQPNVPFSVPARLLKRKTEKINGIIQESFVEDMSFSCSAKSYGGTEKEINGVWVIEDTWTIDTWYHPKFEKGDRIKFLDTEREYEIIASPENINRRGQYMRFKVAAIGG